MTRIVRGGPNRGGGRRPGRPRVAVVDLSRGRYPSPEDDELGASSATHGRVPAESQEMAATQGSQPIRASDGPVGGTFARERVCCIMLWISLHAIYDRL